MHQKKDMIRIYFKNQFLKLLKKTKQIMKGQMYKSKDDFGLHLRLWKEKMQHTLLSQSRSRKTINYRCFWLGIMHTIMFYNGLFNSIIYPLVYIISQKYQHLLNPDGKMYKWFRRQRIMRTWLQCLFLSTVLFQTIKSKTKQYQLHFLKKLQVKGVVKYLFGIGCNI